MTELRVRRPAFRREYGVVLVAILVLLGVPGLHFWSHTWYPDTTDLSRIAESARPGGWTHIESETRDGTILRMCIDVRCPRAAHTYGSVLSVEDSASALERSLGQLGFEVVLEDPWGHCSPAAEIVKTDPFSYCTVTGRSSDVWVEVTLFPVTDSARTRFGDQAAGWSHWATAVATPN